VIDADEPLIVTFDAAPAGALRARLADVLITTTEQSCPADVFAQLFKENPGLSLVLITRDDRAADVGFRDGTSLMLRLGRPVPTRSSWHSIAGTLYDGWVSATRHWWQLGA